MVFKGSPPSLAFSLATMLWLPESTAVLHPKRKPQAQDPSPVFRGGFIRPKSFYLVADREVGAAAREQDVLCRRPAIKTPETLTRGKRLLNGEAFHRKAMDGLELSGFEGAPALKRFSATDAIVKEWPFTP